MRYNRLTREVEITVGDLCALKHENGVCNMSEVYKYASQHSVTAEHVVFKYSHGDILISLKLELFRRGDLLCECNEKSENGDFLPIKQETSIIAFVYCSMQHRTEVNIESIDIEDDGSAIGVVVRSKTYASLEKFFLRRLARLLPIAEMLRERGERILSYSSNVKFPYSTLRNGQLLMMNECYDAMSRGKRLFVQAPTGIGKTLSVLYPAVKLLGNCKCDKIFYLTAKSSTQAEAYRAAGALFSSGARLRTIVISAKEQVCCCSGCMANGICDAVACSFAKYSDEQMGEAVNELLALQNGYEKNIVTKTAIKHKVCPYELSLCLAEFCEIVIADYNYV